VPSGARRIYLLPVRPILGSRSQFRIRSFLYGFDLAVDHLPCKTINRDMHPVALFSFNDKFSKVRRTRCIVTALGYEIEHQIPRSCLAYFPQCPRD
jgi:hypothetical protein